MPAANTVKASASVRSSPIHRPSIGASSANTPKYSNGKVVSRLVAAAPMPVSARS
jgi:hypothetical protein